MGRNNPQENALLGLDRDLYFIVEKEGCYYVEHNQIHPNNYNINEFIDLLTIEECKFLIAESVLDSNKITEYFLRKFERN